MEVLLEYFFGGHYLVNRNDKLNKKTGGKYPPVFYYSPPLFGITQMKEALVSPMLMN